jgi:N-acetyl-1-D-myo-inositol-2-amino-2-deoxy-alpha-D-glucopyranoside deacetylase
MTVPTLLCVHPHPDDEAISCGGVLARSSDEGVRTVVVTCTGGEEGENQAGIDLGDEDMTVHRRREMEAAATELGLTAHHWLGYRDSGMVDTPANDHPDSFHAAPLDDAAVRLAHLIRQERPQVVVSDDEDGSYGHPDHIKAYAVTVRAVALAADAAAPLDLEPWQVAKRYVHTLSHGKLLEVHNTLRQLGLPSPFGEDDLDVAELPFGVPDDRVTTQIDVAGWIDRKRAAMAAHRSQIGPESFFLNTPDELAGRFFGVEQFVLEAGELAGLRPETDLFAGLRSHEVASHEGYRG